NRKLKNQIVEQLFQLVTNKDDYYLNRKRGVKQLAALKEKETSALLERYLTASTLDNDVRESIADAIGELGDPSALPQLLTLLADNSPGTFVRRSIANAIGELGNPSALPQLLTLLADNSLEGDVRRKIAGAIGKLEDLSALPQLLTLLADN